MFVTCFIVFSFAHAEACAQKQSAKVLLFLHSCKYLHFFLDFFTFRKLYIAFVTHESCICLILCRSFRYWSRYIHDTYTIDIRYIMLSSCYLYAIFIGTVPLVPWLIRYWIENSVAKCSWQKGRFWRFWAIFSCLSTCVHILFAYFFAYWMNCYRFDYQYFSCLMFVLFFVIALACVFIYKKKVVSLQRKLVAYSTSDKQ